jgi:hypothetical protein
VLTEIDIYCHSWVLVLLNIEDVLSDLMDLRHQHDSLYYLLHDVRNFYYSFGRTIHRHQFFLNPVNSLVFSFDLILDVGLVDQPIFLHYLVLIHVDLLNLLHQFFDSHNFLPDSGYLNDLFLDSVGVDGLIYESIHNLVVGNDNGFFSSNLDKPRHFDWLFAYLLYLIDFGNLVNNLHYLVIVGCYLFDSFLNLRHQDRFFFNHLHLLHLFSDIRHDLFNLSVFLLDDDVLFHLGNLFHRCNLLNNLNNLLHITRNFLNFLDLFLDQD